ncbi:graves disease carrier protein isoform X2 [Cimex lectularius]|uniref:Mitochondrial carrier protein n=1 Tax=Cimex lectularius TaxID=79782 RepID=A0A8I6RKP5_CIMLE|nr:graves disease carrier protein isoform X2 [Cimex lectularius]
MLQNQNKNYEFILKSLLAGGVAGMCSKSAVAPLDRIKILFQAHNSHYSHLGVFSGIKEVVQRESLLALYKGNGAQMVRVFPYAATQFTAFELYTQVFNSFLGSKSHLSKLLAGSSAGATAVLLTYPLDTIRARLAFQITGGETYTGIIHAATSIFQHEGGIKGLYRGFVPTLCGMIPYAGLSFYCFEMLKLCCMKYIPDLTCVPSSNNTGGLVLLIPAKLVCGGLAGSIAQSIAYPMDVTRRRMQLAMMDPATYKYGMGMVQTLLLIYKENGIFRGLYRGMSINYLRAMPMVAVSFSVYELMKQALRLDTGLKL